MTLQVYSPQPSRFRLRMVYSVSSRWASKAPACSSRLERSHSKRSTRDGWARSTRQVITTGRPRPCRVSVDTGSTVGGSGRQRRGGGEAPGDFSSGAREGNYMKEYEKEKGLIKTGKRAEVVGVGSDIWRHEHLERKHSWSRGASEASFIA
ncbi:hypothetical protein EYF80_052371 [Liparis tanakae]|uniref:Uncharacterized protein n=1 Tax=Liparis tanakae TaxID=230148 RepID=A0A4Z2F915_9TELE|nr:hypothetical protein EYF80_052371 [Liparis tanakae]